MYLRDLIRVAMRTSAHSDYGRSGTSPEPVGQEGAQPCDPEGVHSTCDLVHDALRTSQQEVR